jgi:GntR family transcriptional regulator
VAQRTLTEQIADTIRRDITSAITPPGAPLQSEAELIERFQVSRGTVRRGLAVLINEGLVESRAGLGYYAREYAQLDWLPGVFEHLLHRQDDSGSGADAWASDVKAQGRTPRQDVDVSIVKPFPAISARLGLQDGEAVVVRKRIRYVDEVPYQLADSYYPRDIAEGSAIMVPGDITVPGGLMADAGHRQARFRDEIIVRMPLPEEAFRLHLVAGTPVAEHTRTGYNAADRPVRVIITIAPGDRHRIIYEVIAE